MTTNKTIIRKYDGVEGIYGERYTVNSKDQKLNELFKIISVWSTNTEKCKDGSYDITYELLIGQRLEDNPLLMRVIKNNNAIII